MTRLSWSLALLLSASAWARTPAEVVRQLYSVHLQENRLEQTVQRASECFTPGFLGIIERALARKAVARMSASARFW